MTNTDFAIYLLIGLGVFGVLEIIDKIREKKGKNRPEEKDI